MRLGLGLGLGLELGLECGGSSAAEYAHGVAVLEAHGARAEANALLAAALLVAALLAAALVTAALTGCAASSRLTALGTVVVAAAAIISSE